MTTNRRLDPSSRPHGTLRGRAALVLIAASAWACRSAPPAGEGPVAGGLETQVMEPGPAVQASDIPGQEPTVALPAGLARVLTDYEEAWQARDAVALAALFAEDGYVLSSGRPPVRGRASIQERYRGSGGPLALRAFHYRAEGSTAFVLGGYTAVRGQPDAGKFTLTLARDDDGRWWIVSDMDNGNSR